MKRFVSLVLVIMMLSMFALSTPVLAAGEITFTVGSREAKAGDSVQIPITVSGNPGFSSVRLNITLGTGLAWDYDPLTYTNSQSTWPFIGSSEVLAIATARPTGANLTESYVSLMFPSTMENTYDNGLLVTLKLKVNETVAPGDISITVVVSQCFDENDKDVPFNLIPGRVTIPGAQKMIQLDIAWGGMEFTYNEGIWNPETHTFVGAGWAPDAVDGNKISVANKGDVDLDVTFTYTQAEMVTAVSGRFVDGAARPVDRAVAVNAGNDADVYLVLSGMSGMSGTPDTSWNKQTVGSVTVTVDGR